MVNHPDIFGCKGYGSNHVVLEKVINAEIIGFTHEITTALYFQSSLPAKLRVKL